MIICILHYPRLDLYRPMSQDFAPIRGEVIRLKQSSACVDLQVSQIYHLVDEPQPGCITVIASCECVTSPMPSDFFLEHHWVKQLGDAQTCAIKTIQST